MGVVDIYNGEIVAMRKEGNTLQSIGDKIGVTRERVRQILNEYYSGTKMPFLPEHQVAKICGCSDFTLAKIRKQGLVKPRRAGILHLYDRDEVERAYSAMQRNCAMCGTPIDRTHKFCVECSAKRRRNIYPFLSQEGKEKAKKASIKWQDEHPDRYRVTLQRAAQRYQAKKHRVYFAETWYEVVRPGHILPLGTVFQAVRGYGVTHLLLADGSKIAKWGIRKL